MGLEDVHSALYLSSADGSLDVWKWVAEASRLLDIMPMLMAITKNFQTTTTLMHLKRNIWNTGKNK
jgi:hypothetical protein